MMDRGAVLWLRAEGLALAAASLIGLVYTGVPVPIWAALLLGLAPDLAFLAYLAGPRVGAVVYNLAHSYVISVPLAALTLFGVLPPQYFPFALIWLVHIGVDRALGYGLKLPRGFRHTHLGLIGGAKR